MSVNFQNPSLELYARVREKFGLDSRRVSLHFNGQRLHKPKTLAAAGVEVGSIIYLGCDMGGGGGGHKVKRTIGKSSTNKEAKMKTLESELRGISVELGQLVASSKLAAEIRKLIQGELKEHGEGVGGLVEKKLRAMDSKELHSIANSMSSHNTDHKAQSILKIAYHKQFSAIHGKVRKLQLMEQGLTTMWSFIFAQEWFNEEGELRGKQLKELIMELINKKVSGDGAGLSELFGE